MIIKEKLSALSSESFLCNHLLFHICKPSDDSFFFFSIYKACWHTTVSTICNDIIDFICRMVTAYFCQVRASAAGKVLAMTRSTVLLKDSFCIGCFPAFVVFSLFP